MQEPVTISFGDDPAFDDDRDYGDDYDDEQYTRQAARKPIVHEDDSFVFGESKVEEPAEVSVPELKAVPAEEKTEAEEEVLAETKPDKKALKAERKAEREALKAEKKAAKAEKKNDKKSNVRAPQVRFPDLDILEDDDE